MTNDGRPTREQLIAEITYYAEHLVSYEVLHRVWRMLERQYNKE